jgi:hypothetical protein
VFAPAAAMEITHDNSDGLTRREFSVDALMALFAGVVITVSSCDDGPTEPSNGDRTGTVSANHGHVATVTNVQVMDGNAVQLNIRGSADHPHTVDLTGAEVVQIGGGQRVVKSSSTDPSATFGAHLHTVTFN